MKIHSEADGQAYAKALSIAYASLTEFEGFTPDDLKLKDAGAAFLARRSAGLCVLSKGTDGQSQTLVAVWDFGQGGGAAAATVSAQLNEAGHPTHVVCVAEQTFTTLTQRVFLSKGHEADEAAIADNETHLKALLSDARERRTSDIRIALLKDATMVQYEIDGRLEAAKFTASPRAFGAMLGRCIFSHLPSKEGGENTSTGEYNEVEQLNATFTLAGGRWRAGLFPADIGPVIVIRAFGVQGPLPSLEELGFSPEQCVVMREATSTGNGLFVVTGPTGSGKSTTLAAIADDLNDGSRAIYSLEDPVERYIEGIFQATVEDIEEEGKARTFKQMGKQLLRQKPNVIIYGEIRTKSTAESAIRMGTTGHMCLGTLHTASAMGAAVSLAYDLGIEANRLRDPSLLRAIVYQRLVSKVCDACALDWPQKRLCVSAYHTTRLEGFFDKQDLPLLRFIGPGCPACNGRGFRGRTTVAEVVPIDSHALGFIAKLDTAAWHQQLFGAGRWDTIAAHALKKIRAGLVDVFECETQLGLLTGGGAFSAFDPDIIALQVHTDAQEKNQAGRPA